MYPNTLDSLCKSKRVPTVEKQSTEQKLFLISFNFFLSCTRTAKKTNKMNVKNCLQRKASMETVLWEMLLFHVCR